MPALETEGGKVCNSMCVYVCDECEYMCKHIHVCDQWNVTQLRTPFEGEVGMLHNEM